jgi:branched-chain amino acid transport system permease protein
VLCLVLLALLGFLVIRVREGTTGRYLAALRGSETAAASIGIDAARARVIAFMLSAALAAFGGGLLAILHGQVVYTEFQPFTGLFWVLLVVTLSTRTVEGAIQAGAGYRLIGQKVLRDWLNLQGGWLFVFFGLGALTFARHPEGILEFNKRKSLNFFQRRIDKLKDRSASNAEPNEPAPALGGGGS